MANRENIAVLGEHTVYEGDLTFEANLRIKGQYNGTITSKGILFLDETSHVIGEVQVGRVVVAGQVTGNITASEHIDVLKDSVIVGNLKSPVIKIADGVKVKGRCQMLQDVDSIDIFSTTVNQLKKSISTV